MRKQIILITCLLYGSIFATTYNTITINGTNSGWGTDEDFTDVSSGDNAYFTWDENYIYFGIADDHADYSNMAYYFYFDTDPAGSNGTTDSYAWGNNITTPFSADYVIICKYSSNGNHRYIDVRDYNDGSSAWDSYDTESYSLTLNTNEVEMAAGTDYIEFRFKRSILGVTSSTDKVSFCSFAEQGWGSNWRFLCYPSSGWTDADRASGQSIGHYRGYILGSGYAPDASGAYDGTLPVELTSFTAASNRDGNVLLEWETASEIDNLGFLLDRKTSSENWTEIASYITHPALQGQGSVSYATRYAFLDESVISGTNYDYRLADVDIFGNVEYHPLQALNVNPNENLPSNFELVSIYPNPFNPSTIIEFSQGKSGHVNIDVIDITGRTVKSLGDQDYAAGRFSIKWDGSMDNGQSVSNGIYFIQIQAGDQLISRKIVYLK